MKMMRSNIYKVICAVVFMIPTILTAQEEEVVNEVQPRMEFSLGYDVIDDLEISFSPEIRFEDNFSVDKYLLELGLDYKVKDYLKLSSAYRYLVNKRETKSTEYSHNYSFSATGSYDFNRFTSSLRVRYSNDADDETVDEQFLRYKASLKYDIPKCKFTPSVAIELFQGVGGDSYIYKTRYSTGVKYKLLKNNYLQLAYKFDLYKAEYVNKHIVSIGYKLNF